VKIGWEQWGTHRGKQEGENLAFRVVKGQVFPTCKLDRVSAEAMKRRNMGSHLQDVDS